MAFSDRFPTPYGVKFEGGSFVAEFPETARDAGIYNKMLDAWLTCAKEKEEYINRVCGLVSKLERQVQSISEENDYFHDVVEDLNEQLRIKDIVMKNLEHQLMLSTDQNDLILDEFVRVKLLTDNEEIHALCERAHVRMRQNVPVIERNRILHEQAKRQIRHMVQLIDIAQEALNMAGKAQHGDWVYVGADPKFAKQSLQNKLDEFKSMYKDEG